MNQADLCIYCKKVKVNNRTGICQECRKFTCKRCGKINKFNKDPRNICVHCSSLKSTHIKKYSFLGMV